MKIRKNCRSGRNPQSCMGGYYPPAKRILGLILALTLLLSFAPISASAAIVDRGECGTNLTWTLDSNGTLTISGTGEMRNYYGTEHLQGAPWSDRKNIKRIIIENGVTSIGDFSFADCINVTSVTIPNTVEEIGWAAFSNCVSIPNINIPNSVTSLTYGSFEECNSLTHITIPDGVMNIIESFRDCSNLVSVNIGNCKAEINAAVFMNCNKLTEIHVSPNNSVYSLSDGVLLNKEKTEILCCPPGKSGSYLIPNNIVRIGEYAFDSCEKLTSIKIPSNVTNIGEFAFRGCSALKNIDIPRGIKEINEGTFISCTNLNNITIPDSVTSIGYYAFAWCDSLSNITIPNSVTSQGGDIFGYCKALESITLPNNLTNITCMFRDSGLRNIKIPQSITTIGWDAFRNCVNLKSVVIPSSVTSIEHSAFNNCKNLTDVYYSGSKQEWNKISIGNYNDDLLNVTIHYNYKSTPSEITKVSLVSSRNGVYKFSAGYEATERGKLVAVVYKDGAVSGYTTLNVLPGSSTASVTVNAASGADNAKFFIWDSLENMRPLSDTYNMNL